MILSIPLSTILVVSTSATASLLVGERTPSSLPLLLKTVLNSNGTLKDLVQSDLNRIKAHKARPHAHRKCSNNLADSSAPLSNLGPLLLAGVGVGTPPTTYQLIVDTGSSITFVGAEKPYVPTSSSKSTGKNISATYGSGAFSGTVFTDTVTLGNLSVNAQSIGVAQQSVGLQGLGDGILGLGPDDLTQNSVKGMNVIPTVTDNLAQQGQILSAAIGLSIPPTNSDGSNPSIDFGAPDSSKFTGDLHYVPITQQSPSNQFWGIDQSISYGSSKIQILGTTAGVVDSGTTLLLLASDAFQTYAQATGATLDAATGLLKVDNVNNLQSLFFNIGENVFEFTANAQIWPRSLNVNLGGDANATYLIAADIGSPSNSGLDFINGFTFIQRFYTVFDTANNQVGFATTPFTHATSN